jgi:transmembrane sensor
MCVVHDLELYTHTNLYFMTREDFIALYEKCNTGNCTPEEYKLLEDYLDEFELKDLPWTIKMGDKEQVRQQIAERLNESITVTHLNSNRWKWWLSAAAVLLFTSISVFFFKSSNKSIDSSKIANRKKTNQIAPGGNKAYLTMANGAQIILNDVKNGDIALQAGIKVSKTKDGMLVYHINKSDKQAAGSSATEWNTITTPRGGQYEVELQDGSKVWLNAASSLRFPIAFTGNSRNVELTGEAYFEVSKNKLKPFFVQANGTSVQVLGTHFNVSAYSDNDEVTTTLLEGSVRLQKGSQAALLIPGQQGVIAQNSSTIVISKADLEETMAWKNGNFVFHDENITSVMKQISRWYDVDVEYTGNIKNKEFGGTVSKFKNITEMLDIMELTGEFHYKMEGRRVIIMK